MAGNGVTNDLSLSGSASRPAGLETESGTATVKAMQGTCRLDLSFSSGARSEIRSSTANGVAGTWTDSDRKSHPIVGHNLLVDDGWLPLFTLAGIASSPNTMLRYVGSEERDGSSLLHIVAWQQVLTNSGAVAILPQHLSQMDIFLDQATFLPVIFAFNVHPDNDALVDIPVEIHFSDYRSINGIQIPFHIQKFLNNGLLLDIQFQNAVINSGLTASSIANY